MSSPDQWLEHAIIFGVYPPSGGGGGIVDSVTGGSPDQVVVDNTDPANPVLLLSETLSTPGTFTVLDTVVIDAITDDNSMATASNTSLPTSSSVKAYVDEHATILQWTAVAGTSQSCAVKNGYVSLNAAQTTFSLPATAAFGSIIAVQGHGAGGWVVNANTGQTIFGGSAVSTSGGSVASQASGDNIYLLCVVEDTEWRVTSAYSQGLTYS